MCMYSFEITSFYRSNFLDGWKALKRDKLTRLGTY